MVKVDEAEAAMEAMLLAESPAGVNPCVKATDKPLLAFRAVSSFRIRLPKQISYEAF